jgi:UDP-glucose 4-epimerase
MHPKRILITGSSGFIGSWLRKELGNYFPDTDFVYVTSRKTSQKNAVLRNGLEIFPSREQTYLLDQVDCILLNGSQTPKNKNDLNSKYDSNLKFLKNLTSWSFPNLEKVIHASSIDVYAKSKHLITERSSVSTLDPYAASKIECEEYVGDFCSRNGISFTNMRIGHIYGAGDEVYEKIIPTLYRHFIRSDPIFLPEDTSRVSLNLLYVGDLVRIYAGLIHRGEIPNVLNAINGSSIKLQDLISIFEKIYKKSIQPAGLYAWESEPNSYEESNIHKWVDKHFAELRDVVTRQREYYEKHYSS